MFAAYLNRPAVVRRLLRAGADTAARTPDGRTALQWAKEKGHAECERAFEAAAREAAAASGAGAGGTSSGGASSAGSRGAKTLSPAVAAERASSGGVAVPDEVVAAVGRGDEEAVLAWLEVGGRVNATYEIGAVSGLTMFVTSRRHGCDIS